MREIKPEFTGVRRFLNILMGGNLVITIDDECDAFLRKLAEMREQLQELEAKGLEDEARELAAKMAAVIAVNHSSFWEPPVVYSCADYIGFKQPSFMAKASLWKYPFLGWLFQKMNFIPVVRDSSQARDSLIPAYGHLFNGGIVGIYFEGKIPKWKSSEDRKPVKWRQGVSLLQNKTGAFVIPVVQLGARKVSSGNLIKKILGGLTALIRRPPRRVHFGAPIPIESRSMVEAAVKANTERLKKIYNELWDEVILVN
jgi:1-acyl-sn-glycerol-3-phosphate acyltransferase